MTLQSHPNVEEVGPSPSCSTSTSSTDVSPYPYSVGEKTIVLNNEEQTLVGVVTENEFLGTNPNIWVESSTHVDIGNRTFFHGDVTIYQNFPNNVPEVPSGPIEHAVNCTKTVRVIPVDTPPPGTKPSTGSGILKRHFKAIMISLTVLTIVCATILIVLRFVNQKPSSSFTTIHPSTEPETPTTVLPDIMTIYTFNRSQWGSRNPINVTKINEPVKLVVIKHTGGSSCHDIWSCFTSMTDLQNSDVGEENEPDIRYNFVIGGDGNIYEGRGWGVKNSELNNTIDIAYMGDFNKDVPTQKMINAGPLLVVRGALNNHLDPADIKIVCHNQTKRTDSPGENLYKEVIKWKFYSNEIVNASSYDGV